MILSILVLVIILYGLYKHIYIYNKFIEGSKESYKMILNLFPTLLGMMLSINILVKSGLLDYIFNLIKIKFLPNEIIPLMILRPISGSSTLSILSNIINSNGPDSYVSVLASIMQGSTDTTIYILTVYFGSVGIKKIRYALYNGLLADIGAFIISIIAVNLFYRLLF